MSYRRAARVDENQSHIVAGLRKMGCSVLIISQLKNCFDILVGWKGKNYAFEIKNSTHKNPLKHLTEGERKFLNEWNGHIKVIQTLEEIIIELYR